MTYATARSFTRRSVNRAFLHGLLRIQEESRLLSPFLQNPSGHVVTHRGSMLEPVSRPTTHQPHISHFRVTVDQEISARRIFILAHSCLNDRSISQTRETF